MITWLYNKLTGRETTTWFKDELDSRSRPVSRTDITVSGPKRGRIPDEVHDWLRANGWTEYRHDIGVC